MKGIDLHKIVKVIRGDATHPFNKFTIKDAVRSQNSLDVPYTLYFHLRDKTIRPQIFKKYAPVAVVTENPSLFDPVRDHTIIIQVKDTRKAYWRFVDYYRDLFDIPVIGVTGTSGKTTVKEMIKHILSTKYKVQATYRSYNTNNSDLRYLLRIDDKIQAAVYELGVGSPGDLTEHCRHLKPQIRVLLNIGVYHLTGCKTPEGYIRAKAELLNEMDRAKNILILNADDKNINKIDVSGCRRIVYFGLSDKARYRASRITTTPTGTSFTLTYRGKRYRAFVPGLGKHNVYNALAAIAAVRQTGIGLKDAIASLKEYRHMRRHLELKKGPGGCTILDDTWNNTPPAMEAAIGVLKDLGRQYKRTIAVLGYMYNLGESKYAQEQYARMGKVAAEAGVDLLVIIGKIPLEIGKAAIKHGMDKRKVRFVSSGKDIPGVIAPYLGKDSLVLLKASEDGVSL